MTKPFCANWLVVMSDYLVFVYVNQYNKLLQNVTVIADLIFRELDHMGAILRVYGVIPFLRKGLRVLLKRASICLDSSVKRVCLSSRVKGGVSVPEKNG